MARFVQGDNIFADEDVLGDSYVPNKMVARTHEMEQYQKSLQSVVEGAEPTNIFVYGETGVGKTLATKIMMNDLVRDQENFDGVSIETFWANCKDSTSYQTTCRLVNQVRSDGQSISLSGHPRSNVNDMLFEHIDKLDATHALFILDEVDSFGTDDEILYEIPRARSNGRVEETKVGLIGISNNFTFRENLSRRVQSSLCENEIHFPPYDANELRAILTQRSREAFLDGVLDDDVIPLTAALTGQDTGSARHALNVLYKAGSTARANEDEMVTEEHVRHAINEVDRNMIEDELQSLPRQSHLVIYALLTLHKSGDTPARRKEIYDVYEAVTERLDITTKTPRTIHNRLSSLDLKGFLRSYENNDGIEGGKYYTYEFDINIDLIESILSDNKRLSEAMDDHRLSDFA